MAKSNRKGIGCLGFIGLLAGGFIAIMMIAVISESSASKETSNVALATAFLIPVLAAMWFLLRNAYGPVYDNVNVPDKIDVSDITPKHQEGDVPFTDYSKFQMPPLYFKQDVMNMKLVASSSVSEVNNKLLWKGNRCKLVYAQPLPASSEIEIHEAEYFDPPYIVGEGNVSYKTSKVSENEFYSSSASDICNMIEKRSGTKMTAEGRAFIHSLKG